MPTDVVMPQMGESIFEGTITRWLRQPGEAVRADEPLFEISTDKVDVEIPAPAAGVLAEILVPEGATAQVNTVVARIAAAGESVASLPPSLPPTTPKSQPNSAPAPTPAKSPKPTAAGPAPATASALGEIAIVMPQMGESIFEGTITRWLRQPGDPVRADEPLFEISTDKVDVEIPAPAAGALAEILVPEGATAQVNTVVARLRGTGAATASKSVSAYDETSTAASAPTSAPRPAPTPAATPVAPPAPASVRPAAAAPAATAASDSPPRSSPLVRRIAREQGVDLARVRGTGSAGRITRDDMLAYLASPQSASPQSSALDADAPTLVPPLVEERVPMSRMRAMIAERMLTSRRLSAHAHTVFRIDMTRIVRLREREKTAFEARHGVRLTYMPFVAAAAIAALRRYPILNASIDGDSIQYHGGVNLGIAVALDWGLIVPVVAQADRLSFAQLAAAIADLAERARAKKLKPEEVSGGTFTLTNSGLFGEEFGTPILNQPESAILAIGGLKKAPVVLTDAEGNDTIAIRSVQHYCLGIDHRLIDGADAGRFMTEFKRQLEDWSAPIL